MYGGAPLLFESNQKLVNCLEGLMARKKISTTVYITQEQSEQLKQLNEKTKVPVAEYIREGIDLVLDRHKELLPGQISFVDKR
jgi:hypothetical protein